MSSQSQFFCGRPCSASPCSLALHDARVLCLDVAHDSRSAEDTHTLSQANHTRQGGGRGHTSSWALSISSSVPPWASQCLDSPKRPRRRYACEHRTVRQWGAGGRYLPRSAVLRVGLYRPEVPTMSGACKVRGCESGEGARIEVTRRVPCSQAPRCHWTSPTHTAGRRAAESSCDTQ